MHFSHLPGRLAQKHHYQPTSKEHKLSIKGTVRGTVTKDFWQGEVLLWELHATFLWFHVSYHNSHSLHVVGTVRSEFRKGRCPCFPSTEPRGVYTFPLPACLRPWENFTQNILEWAMQHSNSALELSRAQVNKQCSLETGHIHGPSDTNAVVYWSLGQNKVDKLLWINKLVSKSTSSSGKKLADRHSCEEAEGCSLWAIPGVSSDLLPLLGFIFIVFFVGVENTKCQLTLLHC